MRRTASEKLEAIKLVENSDVSVRRTLEELGLPLCATVDPNAPPLDPSGTAGTAGASPSKPPPPPRATATPWYKDWVAVGLFTGGAVGLAVGGLSYNKALNAEAEAEELGTTYDEFLELRDSSKQARNFAVLSGVVGGLLVGGGITYLVLRKSPGESESPVAVQLGPDSAGFTFSGHF